MISLLCSVGEDFLKILLLSIPNHVLFKRIEVGGGGARSLSELLFSYANKYILDDCNLFLVLPVNEKNVNF